MKQNHEEHKEKHHHNHEAYGCGHDHEHEVCGCGHDREYGSGDKESHSHVQSDAKQKVYILENLGCANCAAKMERKIKECGDNICDKAVESCVESSRGSSSDTAGNLCIDRV